MVSLWWWLPLTTAACAGLIGWWGIVRLGREHDLLQQSLSRLRDVRPLLDHVKSEIEQTRRGVQDRGPR